MIITNYYINAGVGIICLIVGLLHMQELDLIDKASINKFRFLAGFIMLEIVIDTLFKTLEGLPYVETIALYVLKATEFSLNPLLPYLVVKMFTNDHNAYQVKWISILQLVLIWVNVVAEVGTIFFKYVFYIDEANHYQRMNFVYVYTAALTLSVTLMIIALYILSKKTQSTRKFTLYGLYLILLSGFALRLFFPETNYDWLCVAISYFVIDIYYVNLALRLDPLTHLLNRQVYQAIIEKIDYSTAIIMIDANNLKVINDSFGHECGDKTLQSIARCIRKAYAEYGYCFRLGGDEFCVILKAEAFKILVNKTPRSNIYAMVEGLMQRFDEIVKVYSSKTTDSFLEYGAAQGYGVYYSPIEYPSMLDHMPIDKVIKVADDNMYIQKAEYKKTLSDIDISKEQKLAREQNQKRSRARYAPKKPEFIEDSVQK